MLRWLATAREFLGGALRRLPVETVLVSVAALAAIATVHEASPLWPARLILAALLATPVAFAAHGLGRRGALVAGALAAAASLAAITAAVESRVDVGMQWFGWPYGLALLSAVLLPFVAAARRFTPFVRRFFEQTTTWGLLYLVASAAFGVVAYALHELLGVSSLVVVDGLLVVTAAMVLCWLHALLPDTGPVDGGRMPEIWRKLATAIGAPFVSVMLGILVLYEALVLARGELPANLLSPLIMTAGFVGYLCTLVIAAVVVEPVGSGALAPAEPHHFTRKLSVRLVRAFPLVLLALLPMAAWALWVRIDQYGLTPFRVARLASLACLAVLSVAGVVRWLRRRPPLGWEVPAAATLFAVACAAGAVRLSVHSQAGRLERLLDEAGVVNRTVAAETPAPTVTLTAERLAALDDAVTELAELGGEPAIRRVLGGDAARCAEPWASQECLARLGIATTASEGMSWARLQSSGPLVTAAGTVQFIELSALDPRPSGMSLEANALVFRDPSGRVARASLDAAIVDWAKAPSLPVSVVTLARDDGSVAGQVALEQLEVQRAADGGSTVNSVRGVWLPR